MNLTIGKIRFLKEAGLALCIVGSSAYAGQYDKLTPLSNSDRETAGWQKFLRIKIKQPGKPAGSELESKLIIKSQSPIDPQLVGVIPTTNDDAYRIFQAAKYVDLRNFDLLRRSTIAEFDAEAKHIILKSDLFYDVAFHVPYWILPTGWTTLQFKSTHNVTSELHLDLSDSKNPRVTDLLLVKSQYPPFESIGNPLTFGSTSNLRFDALMSSALRYAIENGMANELVDAIVEDFRQSMCGSSPSEAKEIAKYKGTSVANVELCKGLFFNRGKNRIK